MFSTVSSINFSFGSRSLGHSDYTGPSRQSENRDNKAQNPSQISSQAVNNDSPDEQTALTYTFSKNTQKLFHPVGLVSEASSAQPVSGGSPSTLSPESSPSENRSSEPEKSVENQLEMKKKAQDQVLIGLLAARDREVRAHEQAHMAVGGAYAGAAKYQFQRGPDGVNYAVGGEVPIDVSKEARPEQTIRKAQIVRRAALAPAEPSPQDRLVAAEASRMEMQARQELALEQNRELREEPGEKEQGEEELNSGSDELENSKTTETGFEPIKI